MMTRRLRTFMLAATLGFSLLLAACGGGGSAAPTASSGGGSSGPVTLELASDGENLAFDKKELTASSGQQVTIKFTDTSTAQQHNWVLANGGDTVAQTVATEGLGVGPEKGYLPDDTTNIIAHTPLANAGETVEVTFTAPAPGIYTYFCTVAGHYPLMKGTLTVQ